VDRRGLDELRNLEARGAELAEAGDRLRELDAAVAQIRERAEAIDSFFASYPDRRTTLRSASRDVEQQVEQREAETAAARAELQAARDDEARARAQRALARAEDHFVVACAALERAQAELAEAERNARALPDELTALQRRAAAIAADVPHGASLGEERGALVAWASAAHAELFVALGYVDTRREQVIREASELASMLLGESTFGATVAQALARVEAA
jgi:chromosome segregation ATPase